MENTNERIERLDAYIACKRKELEKEDRYKDLSNEDRETVLNINVRVGLFLELDHKEKERAYWEKTSNRHLKRVCDLEEEAAIQLLQVPCMHAHACMHVCSPDVGHPYMFARRRPQGTQRRRCRRSLQGRMWCSQRKVAWGR